MVCVKDETLATGGATHARRGSEGLIGIRGHSAHIAPDSAGTGVGSLTTPSASASRFGLQATFRDESRAWSETSTAGLVPAPAAVSAAREGGLVSFGQLGAGLLSFEDLGSVSRATTSASSAAGRGQQGAGPSGAAAAATTQSLARGLDSGASDSVDANPYKRQRVSSDGSSSSERVPAKVPSSSSSSSKMPTSACPEEAEAQRSGSTFKDGGGGGGDGSGSGVGTQGNVSAPPAVPFAGAGGGSTSASLSPSAGSHSSAIVTAAAGAAASGFPPLRSTAPSAMPSPSPLQSPPPPLDRSSSAPQQRRRAYTVECLHTALVSESCILLSLRT